MTSGAELACDETKMAEACEAAVLLLQPRCVRTKQRQTSLYTRATPAPYNTHTQMLSMVHLSSPPAGRTQRTGPASLARR